MGTTRVHIAIALCLLLVGVASAVPVRQVSSIPKENDNAHTQGKGADGPTPIYPGPIQHVVAVMFENRAFDHMLGYLKSVWPEVDGLDGSEWNYVNPKNSGSGKVFVNDAAGYTDPDFGHSFDATNLQMQGCNAKEGDWVEPPPMSGFVCDGQLRFPNASVANESLSMFNPKSLPIMSTLAQEFALLDKYFAAVPAPTEVNRQFVHSATSQGMVDQDIEKLIWPGLTNRMIYENLDEAGVSWNIYSEEISETLFYQWMREPEQWDKQRTYDEFKESAKAGTLPTYSWVTPRYYSIGPLASASDQHPSHNVAEGEKFLKDVYETMRASPLWNQTALVILYDEHGGFYDHVPPPHKDIPAPDDWISKDPYFNFTRLGVRVPALVISPWVDKHTLISYPTMDKPAESSQYTHSSILSSLKTMFGLEKHLTRRDEWAAPLHPIWQQRKTPRTDCPMTLPNIPAHMLFTERTTSEYQQPPSDWQCTLLKLAEAVAGRHGASARACDSFATEGEMGLHVRDTIDRALKRRHYAEPKKQN